MIALFVKWTNMSRFCPGRHSVWICPWRLPTMQTSTAMKWISTCRSPSKPGLRSRKSLWSRGKLNSLEFMKYETVFESSLNSPFYQYSFLKGRRNFQTADHSPGQQACDGHCARHPLCSAHDDQEGCVHWLGWDDGSAHVPAHLGWKSASACDSNAETALDWKAGGWIICN